MIPFANRFHGHGSLRYVYKNGEAIRSRLMTIKAVANSHRKVSRVAVVISKKVLKSAVGRNRIRRRVYEYIRSQLPFIDGAYDIAVIVSSSELLTIPYGDVSSQLDDLFSQAGVKRVK